MEATLHQCIELQAQQRPQNIAIIDSDQQLTYAELNQRSNQLARVIRKQYTAHTQEIIEPDTLIAICLENSIDTLIGLLAILKAGAAYVPIDPNYPQERIKFIIEDANAALLLTHSDQPTHHQTLTVALRDTIFQNECTDNLNIDVKPNHLAYVIYTSGTTGKPKGVMVEHRNICHLIQWYQHIFEISAGDCCSQFASVAFDVYGGEVWPALTNGARVDIAPQNLIHDAKALLNWIQQHHISICDLPTQLAELLFHYQWPPCPSLRILKIGGEALKQLPRTHVLPCDIYNMYGPTETCVDAMGCRVYSKGKALFSSDNGSIPIHANILEKQPFTIVNQNLSPCAIGDEGELLIGGASVTRGYLNRLELTQDRFLTTLDTMPGRWYRTGDLVRQQRDGRLDYIGRNDKQVKIRGYRVELGEVEAQLLQQPHITQACVMTRSQHQNIPSINDYLIAYFTATKPIQDTQLQAALAAQLPLHLIPSTWVQLTQMPLTPNGKIDHDMLANQVPAKKPSKPPRDATERQIRDIWETLLCRADISIDDNFFQIGGNSILALSLQQKLQEQLGWDMNITILFEHPSIAALAAHHSRKVQSVITLSTHQKALRERRKKRKMRAKQHA